VIISRPILAVSSHRPAEAGRCYASDVVFAASPGQRLECILILASGFWASFVELLKGP